MADTSIFASAFSAISQAASRASFEQRFNVIQNGMIGQINKEIDKITDDGTERRLAAIQKKRDELVEHLIKAEDYRFGLETNKFRLWESSLDATDAASAAESDGDTSSFTADEAANLNEAKTFLVEKIRNLRFLYFPSEFSDSTFVNLARQDANALEALTAEAGTVDAEGTDPTTNDNRPLLDLMNTVATRAANLSESIDTLVGGVNQLIIDGQTKMYGLEADLAEISAVELARKTEEIEAVKAKYATLLNVISLSFEVNSTLGDMLVTGTTPPPDRTSILNLFV